MVKEGTETHQFTLDRRVGRRDGDGHLPSVVPGQYGNIDIDGSILGVQGQALPRFFNAKRWH